MKSSTDLQRLLEPTDRRSYPAYKDARGSYDFNDYVLSTDHVQGDPFASPSKLSVRIPHEKAGYPAEYFDTPWRQTTLEDYMVRQFYQEIATFNFKTKGSGKSGLITTSWLGPEMLSRMACKYGPKGVIARFEAGFSANGRTINSGELVKILLDFLPRCVKHVFYFKNRKPEEVLFVIHLVRDQQSIRHEPERLDLASFAADKAVLPRESDISNRLMKGSVPFSPPRPLRIELDLPHHGRLTGMGLKRGITLIVGGGYYGRSILLKALEVGAYNHVAGDGREYVITDGTAMKLRAEDGRSIQNTNIPLLIDDLPNKKNTKCFSTKDVSGSTFQTVAVIEGIEAGSRAFLINEDTSATNLMVRDDLMQKIISRSKESITPFTEQIRDLYENAGISTITVVDSSGAYFYIADTIIQMDRYGPLDITNKTKASRTPYGTEPITRTPGFTLPARGRRFQTGISTFGLPNSGLSTSGRSGQPQDAQLEEYGKGGYRQGGFYGRGRGGRDGARGGHGSQGGREERIKVKAYGKDSLQVGRFPVDLRFVEQLIDPERTNALAQMLCYCVEYQPLERYIVADAVTLLEKEIKKGGVTAVNGTPYATRGLYVLRTQEISACINRYRG